MSGEVCKAFNEGSLKAVMDRVRGIDVTEEPLFVGKTGESYVVHHPLQRSLVETLGDTWKVVTEGRNPGDDVVLYSEDMFDENFESVLTIEQYRSDYETLSDCRFDLNAVDPQNGELSRSQFSLMEARLEEIGKDMKDKGLSFDPKPEEQVTPADSPVTPAN